MVQKTNVMVVEDNDDMRHAVSGYLQDNGYVVRSAPSVEAALRLEISDSADVAVLDISLPGMSGLKFTESLRKQGFDGPIIAITARDTIEDKITGLELGMDDYLVKPFDLRELVARINAQLRTKGNHHDLAPVQTTNFKLDSKQHKFTAKKKEVKLTLVEFRLMRKLLQHNHATVHTQDLIEAAWGEDAAISNPPIRIHISNLRSKINDTNLTIIQTIPGVGYMLSD
jgi:two-component system, OmpR family, response regulator CiaR